MSSDFRILILVGGFFSSGKKVLTSNLFETCGRGVQKRGGREDGERGWGEVGGEH
jgi:hypothetical protein